MIPDKDKDKDNDNDNDKEKFLRPIRSFVRRNGRISIAQEKHLQETFPQVELKNDLQNLQNFHEIFAKNFDNLILEIGFGMGNATAEIAENFSQNAYIACDVHLPGVGALCKLIAEKNLQNIKIFCGDALELLQNLEENSLDGINIFFPDPWHKKRHHKRRLINEKFLDLILPKLKTKAFVHLATDWQEYAEHMQNVFAENDNFENLQNLQNLPNFHEKSNIFFRPKTKFELRGEKLGHGVWDFVFIKK